MTLGCGALIDVSISIKSAVPNPKFMGGVQFGLKITLPAGPAKSCHTSDIIDELSGIGVPDPPTATTLRFAAVTGPELVIFCCVVSVKMANFESVVKLSPMGE